MGSNMNMFVIALHRKVAYSPDRNQITPHLFEQKTTGSGIAAAKQYSFRATEDKSCNTLCDLSTSPN